MTISMETEPPTKLRTWSELEQATRQASLVGARLMAGANFANKTERTHMGRLLLSLADAVERLTAQHRHGAADHEAAA